MHKLVIPFLLIFFTCDSNHKNGNWIKTFGGSSLTEIVTQSIDKEGNIIVGGTYTGEETQFGNTTLSLNGSMNAFLLKFDSFGDQIWSVKFGQNGIVSIQDIDTDEQGNIYALMSLLISPLTGKEGEVNFNGRTIRGKINTPLIAKISKTGEIEWIKEFPNHNRADLEVLKISSKNIYVGGGLDSGIQLISRMNNYDSDYLSGKAILLNLNFDGDIQKQIFLDGNYIGKISDIEILDNGSLYVSGELSCPEGLRAAANNLSCSGTVVLNNNEYFINDSGIGFIANVVGDRYKRIKIIGKNKDFYGSVRAITSDEDHNIYLAGNFQEKIEMDESVLTSTKETIGLYPENTIYFSKLDSSFNYVWGLTTEGGPGSDYPWDILFSKEVGLITVGEFYQHIGFGKIELGKKIDGGLNRKMFIALIDEYGSYKNITSDDGEYNSSARSINRLKDGSFLISGGVDGKSNLNGIKFGLNKGRNAFVSKISLFD